MTARTPLYTPLLLLAAALAAAAACSRPAGREQDRQEADTLVFGHARLLRAERHDSFTRVDVADAWHPGRTLRTYLLVPRRQPVPRALPEGTVVRTPLARAVAFSSVHAALVGLELDEGGRLAGVCDAGYLVDRRLRRRLEEGRWRDFGRSMRPDAEALLAAGADALLVSPFENAGYGALEATGIPLIECADYMEPTPLGRAEWMRFYGLLFGCGARADSLFARVEARYARLRRRAARRGRRPRVVMDLPLSPDVWYMPGGGSAMGRLLADAGADYLMAGRRTAGGVALTREEGLAAAAAADIWLIRYGRPGDLTVRSFAREYPDLAALPVAAGGLWGCNTLRLPYHEHTTFRPDRLLGELAGLLAGRPAPAEGPAFFSPLRKE